jgi:GT2 family glycosyltransferase
MSLSIAIPTYQRGGVLLETIDFLKSLVPQPAEIIIVDQTGHHEPSIDKALAELHGIQAIRWHRLAEPSITHAMNVALKLAKGEVVLFLDDDIIPGQNLVAAHLSAQTQADLVAGQVLQPGETAFPLQPNEPFRFNSTEPRQITHFMGGNFSIKRSVALALGGFDENFKGAAFNYEAEFASRYVKRYGPIYYEPSAIIHHLMAQRGGTRAHGHHLRTLKPTHSVGAYYYLLKAKPPQWVRQVLYRPFRSVRTRHHLRHPWWIIPSLLAEIGGFFWALKLLFTGPKYIDPSAASSEVVPSCES